MSVESERMPHAAARLMALSPAGGETNPPGIVASVLVAGVAAVVTVNFTHPIETCKTRLQFRAWCHCGSLAVLLLSRSACPQGFKSVLKACS